MSAGRVPDGYGAAPDSDLHGNGPVHSFCLENEFGRVRIRLDTAANSPRVEVTDLATGRWIFLDPMELATLAWCSHRDFVALVDPSRWWAEEDIPPGPPE